MFAKIKITCVLKVLTGLHIGASSGYAAIGAMDNPVIRDVYSDDPMIPGSSVKGKMRTLLARSMQPPGSLTLPECKGDDIRITRLFGTPADANNHPHTARLQFSDAFLLNRDELLLRGAITEAKAENAIHRKTSVANPRPNERVVRGAEFGMLWFYTAENEAEILEDMETLAEGCRLLSMDYLGGGGTRGNGRVGFSRFETEIVFGSLSIDAGSINACFEDVSAYASEGL